ncbi:MAG TPA: PAS domain S-box protein [Acidimicrobiales bacterium]|nr:PAS domain S-box protein [Acidimicrobiales bacterium]
MTLTGDDTAGADEGVPSVASLLGAIVASSDDAIYSKAPDGTITSWNAGAERLYGWRADEIVGLPVTVLIPDSRVGEERHILELVLDGQRVEHYETERVRRDGRRVRVSITVSPVRDELGVIVGASAIARDITERHRAMLMFQGLLEAAPDAMVIAGSHGRIVLVNRQVEALFGYQREELLDRAVEVLIPERLRDRHVGHRTSYFSEPQVRPMGMGLELVGLRRDGTEFPIEVSLSPFETEGGVLVSAAIRDISDRKRAEAQLEEAHRALLQSERLSALGEMATIIGHELRNPLGAATNALFLIRQRLGSADDQQLQRHLALLERETMRATALCEDLTSYMRQRDPVPVLFGLRSTLDAVFESTPPPTGVDAVLDAPDLQAWADPDQFVQMLTNVLTNAYQAMPQGGTVHVRAYATDDELVIAVRDSGTGVDPDTAARLFEPFFTTKAAGTGLGLVIVRRLVEAHGGTVTLDNARAGGAVVTIRLPRAATGPAAP